MKIIFAGMFLGLAIIIRPSYEITIIPILIFICIKFRKNYKNNIIYVLAFIIGMSSSCLPQLYINYNQGIISPFVQTSQKHNGKGLFLDQLGWGIYVQRYETNISSNNNYPIGGVFFYDEEGKNLLKKENLWDSKKAGLTNNLNIKKYFSLIKKYPVDFLCIYGRHLFNGLDLAYQTPYLTNVFKNRILFSGINYTLWFILLITFANKKMIVSLEQVFLSFILILPSLVSIPCAIESRFFLPMYILCYAYFSYIIIPKFIYIIRRIIKPKFIILYLLFLLVCFTLSSDTFTNISSGLYLFN